MTDPQKVHEALQAMSQAMETLFRELGPPPQTGTYEPTEKDANDPFDLWGPKPSYRCYMTRHLDCEPDGPEAGCTCSCGHQDPVCACSTREVDEYGELEHALGCPAGAVMSDAVKERIRKDLMEKARHTGVAKKIAEGFGLPSRHLRRVQKVRVSEECAASISGTCLNLTEGYASCDIEEGECVRFGRPARGNRP